MDMRMIGENVIECLIPVEELYSRWNVTLDDIIKNNEKGRCVIEFLLSQSHRRFNLEGKCYQEMQMQLKSKGIVSFIIKVLNKEDSDYDSMELPYGDTDFEVDEQEKGMHDAKIASDINLPENGDFPTACYGYRFSTMHEVIHACSIIAPLKCSSSMCKERGKYILILTLKKDKGDALQTILSEFTEDYFYFCKSCAAEQHKEILQRYSNIVIQADAVDMLADIKS